jgi:hypothetical protein
MTGTPITGASSLEAGHDGSRRQEAHLSLAERARLLMFNLLWPVCWKARTCDRTLPMHTYKRSGRMSLAM